MHDSPPLISNIRSPEVKEKKPDVEKPLPQNLCIVILIKTVFLVYMIMKCLGIKL